MRDTRAPAPGRLLGLVAILGQALACSAPPGVSSDAGTAEGKGDIPYLSELRVTSPSGGPLAITLAPPFSPDVHDYYVRCVAGGNVLDVSMTASAGALAALRQPMCSSAARAQTLTVTALENQAVVVVATSGGASTEYWVRCLPHDFPVLKPDFHPSAGVPPPGYYLLATFRVPDHAESSYALVLDRNIVPVWYARGPVGRGILDVDHVVSGAISFFDGEGAVEVYHLQPFAVTSTAPLDTANDPHEMQVLPNGHYVVIARPFTTADLTGIRVGLPDGGLDALGPGSTLVDCDIVEFDPKSGEVAWTWQGSTHFSPQLDARLLERLRAPDGGVAINMFHCNSVDVDPANGNLLVSSRDMSSIFYVERSTGRILWKMGGAMYTKDDATYIAVDDPFFQQHDARLQPGWASECSGGRGQISLFDDHSFASGPARAMVLDVVVGGGTQAGCGGRAGGTPGASVAWQYAGHTHSNVMGSFRISPDGSRVIGWGASTSAPVFTEVDGKGNDLLDFQFEAGLTSYRIVKAPPTAFDLHVLRTTAGRP